MGRSKISTLHKGLVKIKEKIELGQIVSVLLSEKNNEKTDKSNLLLAGPSPRR